MEIKNIRRLMLIAFVFSGIAALIYELTWIRPLQFLLGSTVYTISIIFAVFMFGLALGSLIISKYVDKIRNLPRIYALMEIGIGLYGVLLLSIFNLLPKIYNSLYGLHTNFYFFEFVQFSLVFIVLLIPTTLMGATFPVISRFYIRENIGKGIGEVYAANNLGAIIGSFSAGFILIPLLGIKSSIIVAGIINLILGFVILLYTTRDDLYKKIILIVLILFMVFGFFGNYSIQEMHSGGFYRTDAVYEDVGDVVYYEEGVYATVSVREIFEGKSLFINGKGQGGSSITDLRVNYLLSHLPLLIEPEINKALVIGLGTGTTSGQLAQYTNVKTIEIELKVLEASDYFSEFNLNVLENPNHEIIIDDGRNYLLRNNEKYDVIIPEPSDPWQSFSTNLFSKEFFELAEEDLSENGLYLQWVPIYQMSVEDFKSTYRTFNSVFPYVVGFVNIKPTENTPVKFETSEIILIGSKNEIKINEQIFNKNYEILSEESKRHLRAIRLDSGKDILNLLLFDSRALVDYGKNSKIITDDNLILEFSTSKNVLNQNPKQVIEGLKEVCRNE